MKNLKSQKAILGVIILSILLISSVVLLLKNNLKTDTDIINNTGSQITNSGQNEKDMTEENKILSSVAYVSNINGNVEVKVSSGSIQKNPNISDLLYVGDTITTYSGANISIVFIDDSIVRLPENSSFLIEELEEDEIKIKLNKGSIWGRIIKPFASEKNFSFDNESVSASVRGTSIYMSLLENGNTQISIIDSNKDETENTVEVNLKNSGDKIGVKSEEKFVYSEKEKKSQIEKIDIKKIMKEDKFVNTNTKNDIIFMKKLAKENREKSNTGMVEAIEKEIEKTKPKKEEFESFFYNTEIQDKYDEDIITLIFKDELISKVKLNDKIKDKQNIINNIVKIKKIENNDEIRENINIEGFSESEYDVLNNLEIRSLNTEETEKILEYKIEITPKIITPIIKEPIVKPIIKKVVEPIASEVIEPIKEETDSTIEKVIEDTIETDIIEKKIISDEF